MERAKREYGEEMASLPLAETDPEPTSGVDAQTAKFIEYEGITPSTFRLFGLWEVCQAQVPNFKLLNSDSV